MQNLIMKAVLYFQIILINLLISSSSVKAKTDTAITSATTPKPVILMYDLRTPDKDDTGNITDETEACADTKNVRVSYKVIKQSESFMNKALTYLIVLTLFAGSAALPDDSEGLRKPSSEDIPDILRMAGETQNNEVLLGYMRQLADIGNEQAAAAFAELFRSKLPVPGLPVTRFVALVSHFETGNDTKEILVPLLQEISDRDLHRPDEILVAGALAKYGDEGRTAYLTDEYRKSASVPTDEERNIREYIFEELCKVSNTEASQFVVNTVRESNDPVMRLGAIGRMLESSNPAALVIARENISVESEDFDFMEAKACLEAVIRFGDSRDRDFPDSLSRNSERLFGAGAEKMFGHLLAQAYKAADKTGTQSSPSRIIEKESERVSQNKTGNSDKAGSAGELTTGTSEAPTEKELRQEKTAYESHTTSVIIIAAFISSVIGLIVIRRYFNTRQ